MNLKISRYKISKLRQLFLPAVAVIITLSIIRFPDVAFDAALQGLNVWFNIVLPALLPFFIGSQLLMGLGVVHFMGVLLEPIMRPLFNVPGAGSFVMAMGLASGYPVGAMLTGKMVKKNLCNSWEAERLVSFSNTADPLFMVGAVAVGMLKDVRLGAIIALAHYISALALGVIMRFYARNRESSPAAGAQRIREGIILRGTRELLRARQEDHRPFGELLGDCIKDSVSSMLLILGFIVLFSVIIRIITVAGFVGAFSPLIEAVIGFFNIDKGFSPAIISGFFEITLGAQLASEVSGNIVQKMVIISTIIAWSGLSVHFQVMSMVSDTNIKIAPYIIARTIHAFLAGLTTYILMMFPGMNFDTVVLPAFASAPGQSYESWIHVFKVSSLFFMLLFLLIIFVTIFINVLKSLDIFGFKIVKK